MAKKGKYRAPATGAIHQSEVLLKTCPVQGCVHLIDPKSDLGLCTKCDRIGRVVNYGTTQILLKLGLIRQREAPPEEPAPKGSVLLIPKPGMGRAAILAAAKSTGVNPDRMQKGGRS